MHKEVFYTKKYLIPDQVVAQYYTDIFNYALWKLRDKYLAEDIAQETFLRAMRYGTELKSVKGYRPLLYKIAVNLCVDVFRGRSCAPLEAEPTCEGDYALVDALQGFEWLVTLLPKDERELVVLRFGHDLKIREVAEITKLPLRTVQSRLRSALKKLKRALEVRNETITETHL